MDCCFFLYKGGEKEEPNEGEEVEEEKIYFKRFLQLDKCLDIYKPREEDACDMFSVIMGGISL